MEQLGVTLEGFSFFEIFLQQNAVSLLKNGKQTVENKAMNIIASLGLLRVWISYFSLRDNSNIKTLKDL